MPLLEFESDRPNPDPEPALGGGSISSAFEWLGGAFIMVVLLLFVPGWALVVLASILVIAWART